MRGWRNSSFTLRYYLLLMSVLLLLAGCTNQSPSTISETTNSNYNLDDTNYEQVTTFTGTPSQTLENVYTTSKQLSLTFVGLAERSKMIELLDELDQFAIRATFFVPSVRIAEEPELVQLIVARGHEIANNGLDGADLSTLSYQEMYKKIHLSNQIIEQTVGAKPLYFRTDKADYPDDLLLAAAHNELGYAVQSSLYIEQWQDETEQQREQYLRKYINRGGIITLHAERLTLLTDTVHQIGTLAKLIDYQFVSLSDLLKQSKGTRLVGEAVPGYTDATVNLSYSDQSYYAIEQGIAGQKRIALSFDDWGTDFAITPILDVLKQYEVSASFFLRADGVERNPNLARAIWEDGHDVANHTYSHPIITNISVAQLQEEVVKAHQIITEAIQHKPTMLFRPPTGAFGESSAQAVAATGYPIFAMYDVIPFDWKKEQSVDAIVSKVLEDVKDGSIVLLHILDDRHTAAALPRIIEALQQQGYQFVTVSEMISSQVNEHIHEGVNRL